MKTRLSFAVVLLAVFAVPAFPYQAFMKLGNIKGTATDPEHKEWIEVLSFSWGATQHGAGSPMNQASVTVANGPYISQLGALTASGQRFQTVLVDVASQRYTLQDVLVSSYHAASPASGAGPGGATLTLSFLHSSIAIKANPTSPLPTNVATTTTHTAIVPPNAQVLVNGVAGERLDLLGLRFTSEHDGVLKIRESAGGFFQQAAASKTNKGKVQVKKDYLVFTLTNCTISSFSLNADGTATAGFHFDQYQGPAGGYQP